VRDQVSTFLVDQVYANVNVEGQLQAALPPQLKPLAGPAAGGLRNALDSGINELLQRPRVQQLWEASNRAAHEQFLNVIEGGGDNVSTANGNVTLNLGQIVASIASSFGFNSVASKIPPDAGQITVLKSDQLDAVQSAFKAFRGLTIVLLLLTLAGWVAAVVVAHERRRETLRLVGYSLLVAGILALLIRTLAGNAIVSSLAGTAAVKPAIEDVWSISTSLLVEAAESSIAYGIVVILGAWLAGPTSWARSARRGLAPFLRDPRLAFGAVLVLLLILVAWGPTPATRQPLGLLLFAVLLGIGIEVLRRQTAREYPDATWGGVSMPKLRLPRRSARAAEPAEEPTRLDELERLGKLREAGVLTDEEFAREKASILGAPAS
jgi:Short C-terminal domain